jgi:MFS family permease
VEARPPEPRHPTLRALGLADVRAFVAARFFSMMAHSLLAATFFWHVFDLTGSYSLIGVLGLVEFLPVLPVSLLAGAVADSRDRRGLMLSARTATLIGAAVLWLGAGEGPFALTVVLLVAFGLAVARGFEHPAAAALFPALVPREILQNALVLNSSARNLATVLGPVLAGFAIEAAGPRAAYALSGGFFAVSLALLARVRSPAVAGAVGEVSWAAIREGVAFVRSRPVILSSMSLDMFAVIFAGATALLPVYAEEILDVGPRGYGLLSASMSIGTLLMTLVLLVRPPFLRPGRSLLGAVFVFGLATLVFGLSRSFPLSMAAFVLAGMADQVSVVSRVTIIQLSTPDALRGRVNSVNMIFVGASNELGAAESGFLAALTSATFSVVGGGVACLAALGAVAARVPELARFRIDETPAA